MRDYYEELISLAASGDPRAVSVQANEFAREINAEISNLRQQFDYVIHMRDYLVTKIADEIDSEPVEEEVEEEMKEIPRIERSGHIRGAALELVREGFRKVSAQMVQDTLAKMRYSLGVQQPNAVIGTVLSRAPEFKRTDANEFEFVDR